MSDTPRTDAKYYEFKPAPLAVALDEMTELSRTLERENQNLNTLIHLLRSTTHEPTNTELVQLHNTIGGLTIQNQELQSQLQAMLSDKVDSRTIALEKEVSALREVGDRMAKCLSQMHEFMRSGESQQVLADWEKLK